MKRLLSITAVALITASFFAPAAHAQFHPGYPTVSRTQAQLEARINSGVRSGALTRREAASLRAKVLKYVRLEFNLRKSGNRLTFQERNRLNNELAKLNREIHLQMTDSERRWNTRISNNRPGWFR